MTRIEQKIADAEVFEGFGASDELSPGRKSRRAAVGPRNLLRTALFGVVRASGVMHQMEEAHAALCKKQNELAGRILVARDIPYSGESNQQKLDVYVPTGERDGLPLVVHFHGGGWVRSTR